MLQRTSWIVAAMVVAAGCSGEEFPATPPPEQPAQVGGEYTMQLVNGANGCGLKNWKEGEANAGIPLSVVQSEDQLTATVGQSLAEVFLKFLLGTATLTGQVTGRSFTLGSVSNVQTQKTCELRWELTVKAQTTSQGFEGTLTYRPQFIVQNQDCEAPVGCTSQQNLSALRK